MFRWQENLSRRGLHRKWTSNDNVCMWKTNLLQTSIISLFWFACYSAFIKTSASLFTLLHFYLAYDLHLFVGLQFPIFKFLPLSCNFSHCPTPLVPFMLFHLLLSLHTYVHNIHMYLFVCISKSILDLQLNISV